MIDLRNVTVEPLLLERLKSAVATRLSPAIADSMRVDEYFDHALDEMVVRLQAHVMAHKLADEDVEASYEERFEAELTHEAQWLAVVPAVGLVITTALAAMSGSVWAFVIVAVWALLSVVVYAKNPPVTLRADETRRGKVVVPVASYAAFPESSVRYPEELGRVYLAQHAMEPYQSATAYEPKAPPKRKELVIMPRLRVLEDTDKEFREYVDHKAEHTVDLGERWIWSDVKHTYGAMHERAKSEERRR